MIRAGRGTIRMVTLQHERRSGHEPVRGPLSVCMHRDGAGTVSRTLVEVTPEAAAMRYLAGPPCTPRGPEALARIPLAR